MNIRLLLHKNSIRQLDRNLVRRDFLNMIFRVTLRINRRNINTLMTRRVLSRTIRIVTMMTHRHTMMIRTLISLVVRRLLESKLRNKIFRRIIRSNNIRIKNVRLILVMNTRNLRNMSIIKNTRNTNRPTINRLKRSTLASMIRNRNGSNLLTTRLRDVTTNINKVTMTIKRNSISIRNLTKLITSSLIFGTISRNTTTRHRVMILNTTTNRHRIIRETSVISIRNITINNDTINSILNKKVLTRRVTSLLLRFLTNKLSIQTLSNSKNGIFKRNRVIRDTSTLPMTLLIRAVTMIRILMIMIKHTTRYKEEYHTKYDAINLTTTNDRTRHRDTNTSGTRHLNRGAFRGGSLLLMGQCFTNNSGGGLCCVKWG